MATLSNKRKLAAVTRETQEENPRNGQSRNTSIPRIIEEYCTQVCEEIEGRVCKKLSQGFSRTESRILGALSKLDEFLLNQQIRTHSWTVPETFRNTNVDNQELMKTTPRVILILKQASSAARLHKTLAQSWSLHGDRSYRRDSLQSYMVTGVTEEIRQYPHIMTETQEEIPYCSLSTSSGKQKKARSTSQPQFRSGEYPCDNWSRPDSVGLSRIGDKQ